MELVVVKERTVRQILEKLLVGVAGKAKRRLIDHEKMRGLAKVN